MRVNALVKGQLPLPSQVFNHVASLKVFFPPQMKFLMHSFCLKALCGLIIGQGRKGTANGLLNMSWLEEDYLFSSGERFLLQPI